MVAAGDSAQRQPSTDNPAPTPAPTQRRHQRQPSADTSANPAPTSHPASANACVGRRLAPTHPGAAGPQTRQSIDRPIDRPLSALEHMQQRAEALVSGWHPPQTTYSVVCVSLTTACVVADPDDEQRAEALRRIVYTVRRIVYTVRPKTPKPTLEHKRARGGKGVIGARGPIGQIFEQRLNLSGS